MSRIATEAREAAAGARRQLVTCAPILGELAKRLRAVPPPLVVTCARGSSDHAATYGKYVIETTAGSLVASVGPSVASMYQRVPVGLANALFIAVSQSGQSPDVLQLTEAAKRGGALVVGIVNDERSPLAQLCDLVLPLCAWWLWPELILAELALVGIAGVSFVAPTGIGLLKFRRITSYHTRAAKLCAVVMGAGLLIYLASGWVWLFRIAVVLLVVEALEEIAITTLLGEWRANVPSIFAARRIAKGGGALLALALAPALAGAQQLPDLVPDVADIHFEFGASVASGDVVEGCASATTGLDLLRLSLITRNLGPGNLELGDPGCPPCRENPNETCENPLFVCSPAGGHNHPHYQNFMRYELLDADGMLVGLGGKRSFCLAESNPGVGTCPTSPRHDCSDQGLFAGCEDQYGFFLGCQYIEINGLPSGDYTLRVTMDPAEEIAEANEANNVIERAVTIDREDDPEVRMTGGALAIKPGKVMKFRGRPTGARALPSTESDPTLEGALLVVFDTAEGWSMEFPLPPAGWRLRGKPTNPTGYRYRGAGTDTDPCTMVAIGKRRVRAVCKGLAIDQHLPAAGELALQLHLGGSVKRYCASFGGKTARNDAAGFKRRNAPAVACDSGL